MAQEPSLCRLPVHLIQRILLHTGDLHIAIQLETILSGIPRTFPAYERAFRNHDIAAFPSSSKLTHPDLQKHIQLNAHTTTLVVVAWLSTYRPEIFQTRYGVFTCNLARLGRLKPLSVMARTGRECKEKAFGWGESNIVVEKGMVEIVRMLWREDVFSMDDQTMKAATGGGNGQLVRFLRKMRGEGGGTVSGGARGPSWAASSL
ncbi:hypothetical protein HDU97_001850 [Phlyctochytrium planicorne]|nr:hypothetical protein HDU97_001850 [Phlyctochytrium planicorne]